MSDAISIFSIIRFNNWMDDYGPDKTGLKPDDLSALHNSTAALQARTLGLQNNLRFVRDGWQQILNSLNGSATVDSAQVMAQMQSIGVELCNMQISLTSILGDLSGMKGEIVKADSTLSQQFEAGTNKLQNLTRDLEEATRRLESEKEGLAKAKSTFVDALSTVAATGSESPAQMLDSANASVSRAYNELNGIAQQRNTLVQSLEELSGCRVMLQKLSAVDGALTELLNSINAVLGAVGDAHKDESRFINARPAEVAGIYSDAAGNAMNDIFRWIDTFFANPGSMETGPAGLLSAIVGHYEHYPVSPNTKNDWHYVSLVKLNDQSALWMNNAGVNWLLNLTQDRNLLAIGSDCPYFDSYKSAQVHWEGDVVTGITGPGNNLYKRS